jgi:hypothetical protein
MAYDFKYIRTGTGELSGPSMIWQTEQALTQIGTYADEANTQADEALETANTALNKANNAAEAAERAQNTADTAQAAASHAQETADAAQVAADNAQDTADEALETAQKGVADAAKAQAAADKAQATADAAQDAADAAQLTADNAQNAADKAQDAADVAQQTANDALNAASNSQGSANVAQDTADNARLVAQSTQRAFYEHVREYTPQIAKALGEFEADNTTVNFDNFTDSVKLYITSPDASITGPNGKVNSPFYLWNFTTDDRSSTAQFVYAANGLTYSRYGTIGQNDLVPGTDTYTLENNSKNAILTCNGVASGMTITKSGSLTNTWTASDTHNSYITGTWNIKGITNGTIDLNGVTIANLSDTGFYPTGQQQLQEDNTSFVIEDMTYSADDGLTIKVTVQWLNIASQISWDSWKVDTPAVDTPAVDNVTIKYNSSNELQAKDVAIGGDLGDLASARGQIGDYRTKLPVGTDLNDIISSGTYIVYSGNCTNVPMNGMDEYYVLRVFGDATNPNAAVQKIYSRMGTAGPEWSRRRISDGTWQPWQQLVQTNYIGDGVRVSRSKALPDGTGGLCILSVPEYEGATASAAGTSGLVPPAAASQRENFLTGGGEYKPALSTGGGVMTGSIQINDPANVIGLAPSTNTERGLFLGDKNSVIMGGFDIIQRASDNAKYTQFYSKNSSGHITSLAAVTYEDGTRELVADSPLQINDIQIKQVVDGGRRVIVLSGARGNQGHSFRFSPDTGEAYMDGRVIHAKADTAGYADAAGSAKALGGKAESALSVAYARDSGAMNGKAESALSVNYANSAGQVYLAGSAVQWVVNTSGPAITVPQGGTYNVVCICFNSSGGKGAVKHYPNTAGGTVIPNAPTDYMVAGLCARVA